MSTKSEILDVLQILTSVPKIEAKKNIQNWKTPSKVRFLLCFLIIFNDFRHQHWSVNWRHQRMMMVVEQVQITKQAEATERESSSTHPHSLSQKYTM